MLFWQPLVCSLLTILLSLVQGLDYEITSAGDIVLTHAKTEIPDLSTLFLDDVTYVSLSGVTWEYTGNEDGVFEIYYKTSLNGAIQSTGTIPIDPTTRELPSSLDCGNVTASKKGDTTILVTLTLDGAQVRSETTLNAYRAGVSIIPLIVILVMAMTTRMVELSLFSGIFLASMIIEGEVNQGFKTMLNFLVQTLADADHVYVILFTLFLSGLVGMMQKSGGMLGFTADVSKRARTPRTGMIATMLIGIFIFFDDYANVLIAGETMRPLMDLLHVSREKLSFIVDGTSAPIASISPVSSWVGFEVSLIDTELEKILAKEDPDTIQIKTTGFAVFLQSIKYRYYPIFMLVLMSVLIMLQKDWGPMLVAERNVRVYGRSDGGPNKGKGAEMEGKGENQPRKDQPLLSWNLYVPILLLVLLTFWLLVETGTVEGEDQDFMDKIENSNSYDALLWATMATALLTIVFYMCQFTRQGTGIVLPPKPSVLKDMLPWSRLHNRNQDGDGVETMPRFLMNVKENIESFLYGMSRIFMALIVLTLAWASGASMVAIGADRLFSGWITGGIDPELLPTIVFIVAFFMALATGTSWGTMSILFPLTLVPTYDASNGDPRIFYSTVAGILSGSVAGDHVSPISDTTVISALACDVELMAHVNTQAPYCILIVLLSILCGTIPIGYDAWPNMIGYLIGWVLSVLFGYFFCKPVLDPKGEWDYATKLAMWISADNSRLQELGEDTIRAARGEDLSHKTKELQDSSQKSSVEDPSQNNLVCPITENLARDEGSSNVHVVSDKPVEMSKLSDIEVDG